MNWENIIKTCPKAFEKYYYWSGYDDHMTLEQFKANRIVLWTNSIQRELYDFFDMQSVFIWVHKNGDLWINNKNGVDSTNRIEAESEAFEQAFKIYEKQLNK